jgi:hypothetical protein
MRHDWMHDVDSDLFHAMSGECSHDSLVTAKIFFKSVCHLFLPNDWFVSFETSANWSIIVFTPVAL